PALPPLSLHDALPILPHREPHTWSALEEKAAPGGYIAIHGDARAGDAHDDIDLKGRDREGGEAPGGTCQESSGAVWPPWTRFQRSEEHTSELQSRGHL